MVVQRSVSAYAAASAGASVITEPLSPGEFKRQLVEVIPHLRAFGYSLSGSMDVADDLAQETLTKAWTARDRFRPGTSMRAWTFVILRNSYISQIRRRKFVGEYDDIAAERILSAPASQQDPMHLADVQRALHELPASQREALILIGAGGFSYEEAADICGCAVGTIKSRVSRGREALQELLENGGFGRDNQMQDGSSNALGDILSAVDKLSAGHDLPPAGDHADGEGRGHD